jgi:hypothetical protein
MGNLRDVADICWECHEQLPDHFQMNSLELKLQRPPIPGDISICGGCGAFSVFDGLLHLARPSPSVMTAIMNTPELMDLQTRLVKRETT